MDYTKSRGVITTLKEDGTTRTDYLYRISLKALIYNEKGELLVTREAGRDWHLPGGGMDYDEDIEVTLKRELLEEVGYRGDLEYQVIGAEPMWMDNLGVYQIWIVALVRTDNMNFSVGRDGDGMRFITSEELKSIKHIDSQRTLKFHEVAQKLLRK